MCVVSMVGDHYGEKFRNPQQWPTIQPYIQPDVYISQLAPPPISRQEFESLKREVEEMRALLRRAKLYDEKNGEPDCELEEKMALLRRVAKLVGVDLDAALGR